MPPYRWPALSTMQEREAEALIAEAGLRLDPHLMWEMVRTISRRVETSAEWAAVLQRMAGIYEFVLLRWLLALADEHGSLSERRLHTLVEQCLVPIRQTLAGDLARQLTWNEYQGMRLSWGVPSAFGQASRRGGTAWVEYLTRADDAHKH